MSEGINVAARAFAWWAAGHEGVEARQLLAGLGHLGDFLRAVSTAEIDLELGYNGLDTAEIELQAAEVESEMPNSQTEYSRPASSPSSISERSSRSDADVRIPHSEWPSEDERASNIFKRRFSGPEYAFLERHFLRGSSQISGLICEAAPKTKDYEDAGNCHHSQWVLTVPLRRKLYFYLFVRTNNYNKLVRETIIRGKIGLIKKLERFMLSFVKTITLERLPNLRFLVNDAVVLSEILQADLPSPTLQSVKEYHPFYHFRQQRFDAWKELGFSTEELKTFWDDYTCNLCDALIGMWSHNEETSIFHHDEPDSVRSILASFDLTHRQSKNVPELDANVFDASFIVSKGPFRFKKTDDLREHLSVKGKEILIFTDLEKLAAMRHHAILQNRSAICRFDILTSEDRYTPPHTISIRQFITRLHYSVQASIFLIFFQNPAHHGGLTSSGRNFRIAKELGIDLGDTNDINILAKEILDGSTWESFLDRTKEIRLQDPFMVPLDKLYNALTSWKPRTFWEMRYPGYGNVDMVQLYGFYFGFIVGIAALIALVLTAAQTYTGFKALHLQSP